MNQLQHTLISMLLFNITFHLFLKRGKYMKEHLGRWQEIINKKFFDWF